MTHRSDPRRRIPTVLLAALVLTLGCRAPEPVKPVAESPGHPDERREQLRDRLRAELGELYDAPIPASSDEAMRRASSLYNLLCRSCHGPTGKGTGKSARLLTILPPDLSDPRIARFFSDRAKLQIIAEGIPGTPMIGWKHMLEEQDQIDMLNFMNTMIRATPAP